jgi:hypothetical protein
VRKTVREVATLTEDQGYVLNQDWLEKHGWVAVPVEDAGHLTEEQIDRIVDALMSAGQNSSLALNFLDLPDSLPESYELRISTDDFSAFNAECGIFRFLLTSPELSWAISCNEWFNIFAGPVALVEQMLGKSMHRARGEFLDYAKLVEQGSEGNLVQIARMYS